MAEYLISLDALLEKLSWQPHSKGQKEYIYSDARFNAPCCGRRWGKSQAAGHRATFKMFVEGSLNWIVGPTYRLGEKEFRVVYDDFRKLGLLKHCKKSYSLSQGEMRIETPWNSKLEVVSAEKPDSLLGEGLDHVIMSEAATHSRQVWEQFIEPALSDKLGSADFPSTPRGYNWYHGLWELGQDSSTHNYDRAGRQIYNSWQFPTWDNIVRYPGGFNDEEIQRILKTVSKQWFDQEYGAMFTTFAGQIYTDWDDTKHVLNHYEYNPMHSNYLTFDYGFSNPFVCLDIQVDPWDNIFVWREYYERYTSTHEHGIALMKRENPPNYRIDGMFGDPAGADEAATLALTIGFPTSIPTPWKLGVEEIKRMLKAEPLPKLYVHRSCTNLIRQMNQLHVKELSRNAKTNINEHLGDGNIQHKVDDHAADALRYFINNYFVQGAGSRLSDVYEASHRGSESEDFLRIYGSPTLTDSITI